MEIKKIRFFLITTILILISEYNTFSVDIQKQISKKQESFYKKIHTIKFWEETKFTNPSPEEIFQKIGQISTQYKIPAIILEAIIYQESSWRQFDASGNPLISPDNGIGLMQITVPDTNATFWNTTIGSIVSGTQGNNPFTIITTKESIDVNKLKTDWKYNLEIGSRILLAKKVECQGEEDDATLLENWYYPLAYYNGFSVGGINDPANNIYSRKISSNSDWTSISIFPYQECIFNIIAQLTQFPSELIPYFGEATKVTLPGPAKVKTGAGNYNYVDPNFKGGDFVAFYEDNTAVINGITYKNIQVHKVNFGEISSYLFWTNKAPMLTSRSWAPAVRYDGKIYVVGGCSSSKPQQFRNPVANLEVYDPTADSWLALSSMSLARVAPAVAVLDGKIYVMGGFDPNYWWSANPTVEIYDITSGQWFAGPDMLKGVSWASAVTVGGKIYVVGGVGYGYKNIVQIYDPISNSWSYGASFNGERYLHALVAYNGKIYLIGGDSWETGTDKIYADVQVYDPVKNTWSLRTPMPNPATALSAVVINGNIYVFGGNGLARIYDITNDTWQDLTSNQYPAGEFSVNTYNNSIYRFGGGGWGPTTNIVQSVDLSTTTIEGKSNNLFTSFFELFQNYPNPFNPETNIQYNIPKATNVSLEIYNTLGQKIRTLVKKKQTAGTYQVLWDGKDDEGKPVASGIYIYQIKAGDFVKARKMVLMR